MLVVSALAACAPAVETAPVDDEVACGTIGDAFRSFSQLIDEWAAPGADVSFEEADAAVNLLNGQLAQVNGSPEVVDAANDLAVAFDTILLTASDGDADGLQTAFEYLDSASTQIYDVCGIRVDLS